MTPDRQRLATVPSSNERSERQVGQRVVPRDATVTIAIATAKGGSGKTTTALHLAVALADRGFLTLAVDVDPQGTLTRQLGVDTHERPTVREVLYDGVRAHDIAVRVRPGLDVIGADLRLAVADLTLPQLQSADFRLRRGLRDLPHAICLIDCPPSLGKLTINALVAADYFLTPVDPSAYSLEGLAMLLPTVETTREYSNEALCFLGPLLVMAEPRSLVTRAVQEQLIQQYNDLCFSTIIRKSQRTREVAFSHETLFDVEDTTTAADYRALTDEICERLGLIPPQLLAAGAQR